MAARLGLILALFVLIASAPGSAQEYQRLHVRSFTLSSDSAHPQLEQPFHVTVAIRVDERVSELRNVFLPTFFGAEELGDESQIAHAGRGTTYRETLTLVAHASGTLSVSPAYLDAVDARDGLAKRFISNSLQLPVGRGPQVRIWKTLRTIALVVMEIALVCAAIFVVAAIFLRKRNVPAAAAVPAPLPPAAPPVPPAANDVDEAWARLRSSRDRASVRNLRGVLWKKAGASAGETLSDVLRRPSAAQAEIRRLLILVERAAFIEDARLDDAIEEVLCSPRL